jgi:hypothetical protein
MAVNIEITVFRDIALQSGTWVPELQMVVNIRLCNHMTIHHNILDNGILTISDVRTTDFNEISDL